MVLSGVRPGTSLPGLTVRSLFFPGGGLSHPTRHPPSGSLARPFCVSFLALSEQSATERVAYQKEIYCFTGGDKSKIKVSAGWAPSEAPVGGSVPGLCAWLVDVCLLLVPPHHLSPYLSLSKCLAFIRTPVVMD